MQLTGANSLHRFLKAHLEKTAQPVVNEAFIVLYSLLIAVAILVAEA